MNAAPTAAPTSAPDAASTSTSTPAPITTLLSATLEGMLPGWQATRVELFHNAPHPAVPGACGVALDMAMLAGRLGPEDVAPLVPPELARAIPRRQLAFVAGRLCAEEALRRIDRSGPIGRGPAGEPTWPARVLGSITHTDRLACALVAPATAGRRGLGIDSEQIDDDASLQAVLALCCTPRERAELFAGSRTSQEDRRIATIVFALKEAFYKAIHPSLGRFVEFDEMEIDAIDVEAGTALLQPTLPEWPKGMSLGGRFVLSDATVHAVVDLAHPTGSA